jgi:TM2 domain-containing membrane protein YozV
MGLPGRPHAPSQQGWARLIVTLSERVDQRRRELNRHPLLAGVLSPLIPGLGQIYGGEGEKGASILAAAIVIGNLNLLFILVFVSANPDPSMMWAYWLPRFGHDLIAIWSIAFWIWATVDAYLLVRREGTAA